VWCSGKHGVDINLGQFHFLPAATSGPHSTSPPGFRNRTPGPPPFSAMNSTLAAIRAALEAVRFAAGKPA
jgi:hypothetical protein